MLARSQKMLHYCSAEAPPGRRSSASEPKLYLNLDESASAAPGILEDATCLPVYASLVVIILLFQGTKILSRTSRQLFCHVI